MPQQANPQGIANIKAAAQDKRAETIRKVQVAIEWMIAQQMKLTFDGIAKQADVSTVWLHKEPAVKAEINRLRACQTQNQPMQLSAPLSELIDRYCDELAHSSPKQRGTGLWDIVEALVGELTAQRELNLQLIERIDQLEARSIAVEESLNTRIWREFNEVRDRLVELRQEWYFKFDVYAKLPDSPASVGEELQPRYWEILKESIEMMWRLQCEIANLEHRFVSLKAYLMTEINSVPEKTVMNSQK